MTVASNRLKLLAILALFILPLLLAALMYEGKLPLVSSETVNQGKLIRPPVPLDWSSAGEYGHGIHGVADLAEHWVILLPLPDSCRRDCQLAAEKKAVGLRQVHRALGREQQRIRLVLLSESGLDDEVRQRYSAIYDQFILLNDPASALFDRVRDAARQSQVDAGVLSSYLVDPLGNIMMAYDMADSETRMSKDLKRLLKWSKQDKG